MSESIAESLYAMVGENWPSLQIKVGPTDSVRKNRQRISCCAPSKCKCFRCDSASLQFPHGEAHHYLGPQIIATVLRELNCALEDQAW